MAGPLDFLDPATMAALMPSAFGNQPQPTGASLTPFPGIADLPPDLQARFANSQTAPANNPGPPQGALANPFPLLPPGVQSKLMGAPDAEPSSVGGFFGGLKTPIDTSVTTAEGKAVAKQGNKDLRSAFDPAVTQERQNQALAKRAADPFLHAADVTQQGLDERKAAAVAKGDAEAQAGDAEAAAYAKGNAEADQIRAEQAKQLKEDIATQQRKQAELDTAQKQYADSKVDPSRFWHDRSTGQTILMGIGLALGGLGAAMKHEGVNPALQIIQDAVKQDISLQMADREKLGVVAGQKGAALDRMMSITRDRQATFNSAIAGAYDRVKAQVSQIAAQSKSPEAKANALDFAGQIDALKGQAQGEAANGMFTRTIQMRDQARQDQQVAIAGYNAATARQGQAEQKREFEVTRADKQYDKLIDSTQALAENAAKAAAAAKGAPLTPQQALAVQEMAIKDQERTVFLPPTLTKNPATGALEPRVEKLTNADGSLVQPPKEAAAELRGKMGAAIRYSSAVDQILDWRAKHGWESKTWNSEDRRNVGVLWTELAAAKKQALALGALSGSDYELLNKSIGTDDPGEVRDPSGPLSTSRKVTWDAVNADLQGQGYDGHARIELPPTGSTPAPESRAGKLADASRETSYTAGYDQPDSGPDMTDAERGMQARTAASGKPRTPAAVRALPQLVFAARQGDPEAIKAVEQMTTDDNAEIARYARAAVEQFKLPIKRTWLPGFTKPIDGFGEIQPEAPMEPAK